MDVERTISASDISAANRRHDEIWPTVRGFGFGSISGFVAEAKPRAGLGFRASAASPILPFLTKSQRLSLRALLDFGSTGSLNPAMPLLTMADSFYIGVQV